MPDNTLGLKTLRRQAIDTLPWSHHFALTSDEEEAVARLDMPTKGRRAKWELAKIEAASTDSAELRLLDYWARVRTIFIELCERA